VETLVASWLAAFTAAESATRSNARYLRSPDAGERLHRLRAEREQTAGLLESLAHGERGATLLIECLRHPTIDIRLLGLTNGITACIFDVEGALTTSAAVHRDAWRVTLDSFLAARSERALHPYVPFDPDLDYSRHLAGRPRLAGLRAFLASRGIPLGEGEPSDLAGAESVHGLAKRKQEVVRRYLDQKGVDAFAGSRAYLQVARIVGVRGAAVSASANTALILERAGIADLIQQQVDGRALEAESLEPKPAPDMLLAACARLGVDPGQAAAFETSVAGITAARAAGVRAVIAVARDENTAALSFGEADVVVNDLGELLERALHR
jgi:beta-phosphoglucomutase-like phosphatase (HAD superfamily)